ncbi:hypothetical protein CCAX7_007300 [Capsulimonas corticalis]|uniref:Uncharacterized protein n=1 Tax=Capsulimonas corticalis TaxID=2219043 RepID=A0A402D1R5_9BACT|nr:hypothetical protein [Capsulimonas corticalis]BDI28679.1 hypothetical protein CCAX7_007300 [Capsulimonas corticalis]
MDHQAKTHDKHSSPSTGDRIATFLMFAMPTAASGAIAGVIWVFCHHTTSLPIALAFTAGAFLVALICFFATLKDQTDFIVVPMIIMALTFMMIPVFHKAHERRLRRLRYSSTHTVRAAARQNLRSLVG